MNQLTYPTNKISQKDHKLFNSDSLLLLRGPIIIIICLSSLLIPTIIHVLQTSSNRTIALCTLSIIGIYLTLSDIYTHTKQYLLNVYQHHVIPGIARKLQQFKIQMEQQSQTVILDDALLNIFSLTPPSNQGLAGCISNTLIGTFGLYNLNFCISKESRARIIQTFLPQNVNAHELLLHPGGLYKFMVDLPCWKQLHPYLDWIKLRSEEKCVVGYLENDDEDDSSTELQNRKKIFLNGNHSQVSHDVVSFRYQDDNNDLVMFNDDDDDGGIQLCQNERPTNLGFTSSKNEYLYTDHDSATTVSTSINVTSEDIEHSELRKIPISPLCEEQEEEEEDRMQEKQRSNENDNITAESIISHDFLSYIYKTYFDSINDTHVRSICILSTISIILQLRYSRTSRRIAYNFLNGSCLVFLVGTAIGTYSTLLSKKTIRNWIEEYRIRFQMCDAVMNSGVNCSSSSSQTSLWNGCNFILSSIYSSGSKSSKIIETLQRYGRRISQQRKIQGIIALIVFYYFKKKQRSSGGDRIHYKKWMNI